MDSIILEDVDHCTYRVKVTSTLKTGAVCFTETFICLILVYLTVISVAEVGSEQ
jgi:hypothetical protein